MKKHREKQPQKEKMVTNKKSTSPPFPSLGGDHWAALEINSAILGVTFGFHQRKMYRRV